LKKLPDVILIKRKYQEGKNLKKRIWRLKELEKEQADTKAMNKDETKKAKDYEDFLNDLETDPEMRSHVNLYRNEKAIKDKEQDKMVDENEQSPEKKKKQHKKKLKVKKSKKNAKAAAGGKDRDDDKEEKKDGEDKENKDKEKEDEDEEEDDPMVKVEELLADLTLEDQVVESNEDEIDDFIRRLEKVKIEGKE